MRSQAQIEASAADRARLMEAVAQVDVLELAGRIIADPRRARVSLAGDLALAIAVERFWEVALEADLLTRALALPETGEQEATALKDHAIRTQADRVRALTAAIRGETNTEANEETGDGEGQG